MQRDNGLMRGKGGSMHLTSVDHGVMGSYAIIGAHLPIACGAAWRAQYKGPEGRLGLLLRRWHHQYRRLSRSAEFRRGVEAAGRSSSAKTISTWNTRRSATSPRWSIRPPIAPRAYGLPRIVVDGNDADAVYRTAIAAYDKARAGGGPSLIECMTYRYSGHSRADPAKYRPEGELEKLERARSDQDLSRAASSSSASARTPSCGIDAEVKRRSRRGDREVQGGADCRRSNFSPTDVYADGGFAWRN